MHVTSLHIYPVKGMRALDLERAPVAARGLEGDRRWLVVDTENVFTTQRTLSRLATVRATPTAAGLVLSAPGLSDLAVSRPAGGERLDVRIWLDTVNAALAPPEVHAWLSEALLQPVRLVYMDAAAERVKVGNLVAAAADQLLRRLPGPYRNDRLACGPQRGDSCRRRR